MDGTAVQAQLAHLRRRISSGDEAGDRQLTALLFDLRNVAELRREVNAGNFHAAERFVALLSADESVDPSFVDRPGAYGLDADGVPHSPPDA